MLGQGDSPGSGDRRTRHRRPVESCWDKKDLVSGSGSKKLELWEYCESSRVESSPARVTKLSLRDFRHKMDSAGNILMKHPCHITSVAEREL